MYEREDWDKWKEKARVKLHELMKEAEMDNSVTIGSLIYDPRKIALVVSFKQGDRETVHVIIDKHMLLEQSNCDSESGRNVRKGSICKIKSAVEQLSS